jgi:hypothetical protein
MWVTMAIDRPTYVLMLRPEPGVIPPGRRLARLLKGLLRAHGLRCVSVEEIGRQNALADVRGVPSDQVESPPE